MTAARATRTKTAPTRLREARARLSAERVAAAARIAALERDIATIAFERAQAMALLEETRTQVEALDTALARVDSGSYGFCESCGQDIAPERLVARPSATLCITCASRRR
jgi:RNA polymerase-binding protein DksA